MNAPKIEERVFLLPDEQKVHYEEDNKIESAANFTVIKEDHTIGNPIRVQLLRNPDVLFAGYRMPHPLIDQMKLKIQTKSATTPVTALGDAITALTKELGEINKQFEHAVAEYKEKENAGAMEY
uniref:DNA-directed RNA polymerase RBP11-like dimerisation domain-containing protein n=1 Tax=Hemiselmis andersenii TaxID=464988 RepID=A0A6U2CDD8_HEMAN|mmetsp:Transcript_18877/g.43599  ORF Transcript_18877/g.43599 Transcript_18877/m.43599 type:complete len:124 (+) Transcript_18877:116-487(+)